MELDPERIKKYVSDMAAEVEDLRGLLSRPDEELLRETHFIKALKYSMIVIAESMANVLQHVLAKRYNVVVRGFTEAFTKAKDRRLVPDDLIDRLLPFAKFRKMLVHQYWRVDDRVFLENLRAGLEDFRTFARLARSFAAGSEADEETPE